MIHLFCQEGDACELGAAPVELTIPRNWRVSKTYVRERAVQCVGIGRGGSPCSGSINRPKPLASFQCFPEFAQTTKVTHRDMLSIIPNKHGFVWAPLK